MWKLVILRIFIVLRTYNEDTETNERTAMDSTSVISILTPTHERHTFLPYLALMIGAQTIPLRRLEWLVVDDSAQSMTEWFRESPLQRELHRITYVHLPHKVTIGCKRNLIKTLATGNVLIHMDDDDYYAPNYVQTVMQMFASKEQPSLIGATTIYLMFPDSLYLYQSGPFRQNHSCGGALSYTKEYANANHFDNTLTHREEPSFIQTNQMMQISSMFNINMVFVHENNTVAKDHLKRRPISLRWIDVIQHPTILHFYLSLHATHIPMHNELALTKTPRANYGTIFYACNVLLALQEMMVCVVECVEGWRGGAVVVTT